jgi:hypothetical protein
LGSRSSATAQQVDDDDDDDDWAPAPAAAGPSPRKKSRTKRSGITLVAHPPTFKGQGEAADMNHPHRIIPVVDPPTTAADGGAGVAPERYKTNGPGLAVAYGPRSAYGGASSSSSSSGKATWTPARKASQGMAIVQGKKDTPAVDGFKNVIARACVVCMLNAGERELPSPIRAMYRDASHTVFSVESPLKMVAVILRTFRAFAAARAQQQWDPYMETIMRVANARLRKVPDIPKADIKAWRSFQAMLRSAEILPEIRRHSNEGGKVPRMPR